MTKILIGMPLGQCMYVMPHLAHENLLIRISANPEYKLFGKHTHTPNIDINRDAIAQESLDKDCDWCLTLDADMSYPSHLLDTLMSRNKDVIGVPYYSPRKEKAGFPPTVSPLVYTYSKEKQGWAMWGKIKQTKPFRVDAVGTGIMLIKTKVFRKLKKPWFPFVSNEYKKDTRIIGEDLSFCRKCGEAGIEIWIDPTFGDSINHWKEYGYSLKDCTEK